MEEVESVEVQETDSTDTATAPSETDTSLEALASDESPDEQQQLNQGNQVKPSLPFSNGGKEKFKVNGQEFEWDWETTKKYAQLGRSGQLAQQRAAETEKKAKEFYGRLIENATADPIGLIRVLRGDPNWQFQSPNNGGQNHGQPDEELDPREAKIRELEQRLNKYEGTIEQQEIMAEQKAIQAELDEAVNKYSVLKNDKYAIAFIKSEYKKALQNGIDVTIDDVAFQIAQDRQESRQKEVQEKQKRIEQKRKQAPVTTAPGAPAKNSKGMSREEVMRLAGRIP